MKALRPSLPLALTALLVPGLAGCAERYVSTGYATVPLQVVKTPHGAYEVLDRPDAGRVAITAISDRRTHIKSLVREVLPFEVHPVDGANSAGSGFFDPLMQYFASTGRTCRLIRGMPLVYNQWEFVYTCSPTFDDSAITWNPAGYSNAPLPRLPATFGDRPERRSPAGEQP